MFTLNGEKVILRLLSVDLIDEIISFYDRNKERISRFNPKLSQDYFDYSYWDKKYRFRNSTLRKERALDFYICLPDRPEKVVGHIRIFNIESTPRESCEIGFTIDSLLEGRGYMHEAISLVLCFIRSGLNLHRVVAQCHTSNIRSQNVLSSLDFKKEGVLSEALFINDIWHDMLLFGCVL